MKICLLRPTFASKFAMAAPLGLGYLSSVLKREGYKDVSFVDGTLDELTPPQTIEIIKKNGIPDIIGIQVYTGAHNWAKEFIALGRKEMPDTKTIVGGPHISGLKELAMEYIEPDFGVAGEGEQAIVEFVKFLEGEIDDPAEVTGLLFKKEGKWERARNEAGYITDYNALPMPDWEILKPDNYFNLMQSATLPLKGKRPVPIMTSRGCPYLCTFCADSSIMTQSRKMRYRSAENVVNEIKFLKDKYGVDEILFSDDNITMDMNQSEELFGLMIREELNVNWRAPNGIRIDRLNENLVKKMAQSGGYYVGVGIETGNTEMMRVMKKHLKLETVEPALKMLNKEKIMVSGFFICGLPGETEEQVLDSLKFALSRSFNRVQVGYYIPYPGSEDWAMIFEENNPEKYRKQIMEFQKSGAVPVFQEMDLQKILRLQKLFLLRFYLRPKILWSLIRGIRITQMRALFEHPWVQRWIRKENTDYYDDRFMTKRAQERSSASVS